MEEKKLEDMTLGEAIDHYGASGAMRVDRGNGSAGPHYIPAENLEEEDLSEWLEPLSTEEIAEYAEDSAYFFSGHHVTYGTAWLEMPSKSEYIDPSVYQYRFLF